jgi:hypothetical protein
MLIPIPLDIPDVKVEEVDPSPEKGGSSRFRGVTTTYSVRHNPINADPRHQARYAGITDLSHISGKRRLNFAAFTIKERSSLPMVDMYHIDIIVHYGFLTIKFNDHQ